MRTDIEKELSILNKKTSFFQKETIEDKLEALDKIAKLGSPYDAKYILDFCFSKKYQVSHKAISVVSILLSKKDVRHTWHNLYHTFRYGFGADIFHKNRLDLKRIHHLKPLEAAHLFGIASLNHNGFIREKAIDYLKQIPCEDVLPYLLLRLNDWVPQVSMKAQEVILTLIPNISLKGFIKHHRLIDGLTKTERVNLSDIHARIIAQLNQPNRRQELFAAMDSATPKERLFCWHTLERLLLEDNDLIDKALHDPIPEVRLWLIQQLSDNANNRYKLNCLLTDKSPRVRYAALKIFAKDDFQTNKHLFESAIFDQSKSIREYARFILTSQSGYDCRQKYLEQYNRLNSSATKGVLCGLLETMIIDDITIAKAMIEHTSHKVRLSAYSALFRLKAEACDLLYYNGLQDSNAKVRNACVLYLHSFSQGLKPNLEDLLKNGHIKSQKAALKVLCSLGGLVALKYILQTLSTHSDDLQQFAWASLSTWYSKYSTNLWFACSEENYKASQELFQQLNTKCCHTPSNMQRIWDDLPNIFNTIKPQ